MKKVFGKVLAIFLVGSAIICGTACEKESREVMNSKKKRPKIEREIKGYTSFRSNNSRIDFTFQYPKNWALDESSTDNLLVYLQGPRDKFDWTEYNLAISKERFPESKSLDEYVENLKAKLEKELKTGIKSFYIKKTVLDGRHARWYAHSVKVNKPDGKGQAQFIYWMREDDVYIKKGKYLYAIRFEVAEEDYDKYRPVLDRLLKTFKFTD